jgi:hypothetical protein
MHGSWKGPKLLAALPSKHFVAGAVDESPTQIWWFPSLPRESPLFHGLLKILTSLIVLDDPKSSWSHAFESVPVWQILVYTRSHPCPINVVPLFPSMQLAPLPEAPFSLSLFVLDASELIVAVTTVAACDGNDERDGQVVHAATLAAPLAVPYLPD